MSYLTDADRAHIRALFPRAQISDIAKEVADELALDAAEIMGGSRRFHIAHARQMVMFIAHREGLSYAAIGRALGVDHTTVMHGVAAHARRIGEAVKEGRVAA